MESGANHEKDEDNLNGNDGVVRHLKKVETFLSLPPLGTPLHLGRNHHHGYKLKVLYMEGLRGT